jgi:murein L,D-transpeptidase YafK
MRKAAWFRLAVGSSIVVATCYYFYPEPAIPEGSRVDHIVVFKSERRLVALAQGKTVKSYRVSLGRDPLGDKHSEGDCRTPEGIYFISAKSAESGYHKNLAISYPNTEDVRAARDMGRDPGGDIKIHGLRNGLGAIGKFHRWFDWTRGCIALTDDEVDELYASVEPGTPIEILP